MSSILRPKLTRIPGMPVAKSDNQIKDLTKLMRTELMEIKEREEKLLADKSKLNNLPDKGKRIQDFYDKVIAELDRRTNVDLVADLFSDLNIVSKGERTLNEIEWSGTLKSDNTNNAIDPTQDVLDSDDEIDMDPLRIIAQRQMHERRVKVLQPEPSLITAQDLEDIKSFGSESPDSGLAELETNDTPATTQNMDSTDTLIDSEIVTIDVSTKLPHIKPKLQQLNEKPSSQTSSIVSDSRCSTPTSVTQDVEQHVRYLVDKTETSAAPQRERFKPYKTTISDVHDPAKERMRKKEKHWEVTAATPPLIQHSGAKLLPLLDSVELQSNYLVKLKQLQEKQASERLAAKLERLENRPIQLPKDDDLKSKLAFTQYRTPLNRIEGDQYYNEDDYAYDPSEEEKLGGGATYTVFE